MSVCRVSLSTITTFLFSSLPFSPDPTITVSTGTSVDTPVVGSVYSLTCTATGAEKLTDSNTTYQWFKDGEEVSGEMTETLTSTSLSFSDAGEYTCQVTVASSLLDGQTISLLSYVFGVELMCELFSWVTEECTVEIIVIHALLKLFLCSTHSNCSC